MSEKWSVNESLLQSYRSIFISSQSFFLAVGAILLGTQENPHALVGLSFLSILIIWYMWFPIVRARGKIVDYHKFSSNSEYVSAFTGISEEDYVSKKTIRERVNTKINKTNWRATRMKIDIGLPAIFTVIWIILVYAQFAA